MPITRFLRPRTHPTYIDNSESETEAGAGEAVKTLVRKPQTPPSSLDGTAVTRRVSTRRTRPESPTTSPSASTRGNKRRKGPSVPGEEPSLPSAYVLDGVVSRDDAHSHNDPNLNQGLRFLFTSSDNWIPFLHAWSHHNAGELRRFAEDVASVVRSAEGTDHEARETEDLVHEQRHNQKAEKFRQYAVRRDARNEVRLVARRWRESQGGLSPGTIHLGSKRSRREGWEEENAESSEESDSEDGAVEEYLVW